jgi:hypothetical protein
MIPSTLDRPGAARFWTAVTLTACGTGLAAAALTRLLVLVQRWMWGGTGTNLLEAGERANAWRHVLVLLGAGVITGLGQIALRRLSSGNGIDITAAIWFHAGRLPALRTLGSAVLSVVIVGMGVSLGREGAPKQAGAVFANFFSDRLRLSDEERRLLVACGAGAGMGAAYGVPLGGALFSLEVMRGMPALRYVPARAFRICNCDSRLLDSASECTDIHYSCLRHIAFERYVGSPGGSDRGRRFGRICPRDHLGGSDQTTRMAEIDRTGSCLGITWGSLDPISATTRERQGCFAARVREPGSSEFTIGTARAETSCDCPLRSEWCTGWAFYAISDGWCLARWRVGPRLVVVLARGASRTIRSTRSSRSSCRHHPRSHFHRGPDDRIDGT